MIAYYSQPPKMMLTTTISKTYPLTSHNHCQIKMARLTRFLSSTLTTSFMMIRESRKRRKNTKKRQLSLH